MPNGDGEVWKDGQAEMEQGNLLKPIIDKDFIFTSKYMAAGLRADPFGGV